MPPVVASVNRSTKANSPPAASVSGTRQPKGRVKDVPASESMRPVSAADLIPVSEIQILHNDRTEFDKVSIETLAASIAERGLDNPITVRRGHRDHVDGSATYQLIAGERRLRAVRSLGRQSIMARVIDADDKTADLLRLEENLLREDLSEIDKAAGIQRYIELHGESQTVVGKRFGISQSQLSNLLRLLKLTDYWKEQVKLDRVPHTLVRDLLLPWYHRPALLDFVAEQHRLAADAEIEREVLELWVHLGLRTLTRSVRQVAYNEWTPITDDTCCFKLKDKDRAGLDVEDVPGRGLIAWNIDAWHAMNAPALKAYRDKQKTAAATRKQNASGQLSKGKPKKGKSDEPAATCDPWKLEKALGTQLSHKLADSLHAKKHKATIVRLFVFAAIHDNCEDVLYGESRYGLTGKDLVTPISDMSDADLSGWMCKCVSWFLRTDYCRLDSATVVALAAMLPLDLMLDWVPNTEVLSCYSDSQLVAFAHDADIDHDQPRAVLIDSLLKPGVWQPGYVPAEVHAIVIEKRETVTR